ncbi:MAG: hypothetical protein IJC04_05225 [Oscillospiraceae bacterium]|nr:hypothetical protein [Oscillospiraceae bacterium]
MNARKITAAVIAVTILAGMTACSDTANETAEVSETTTIAETTTVAEATTVTEETPKDVPTVSETEAETAVEKATEVTKELLLKIIDNTCAENNIIIYDYDGNAIVDFFDYNNDGELEAVACTYDEANDVYSFWYFSKDGGTKIKDGEVTPHFSRVELDGVMFAVCEYPAIGVGSPIDGCVFIDGECVPLSTDLVENNYPLVIDAFEDIIGIRVNGQTIGSSFVIPVKWNGDKFVIDNSAVSYEYNEEDIYGYEPELSPEDVIAQLYEKDGAETVEYYKSKIAGSFEFNGNLCVVVDDNMMVSIVNSGTMESVDISKNAEYADIKIVEGNGTYYLVTKCVKGFDTAFRTWGVVTDISTAEEVAWYEHEYDGASCTDSTPVEELPASEEYDSYADLAVVEDASQILKDIFTQT